MVTVREKLTNNLRLLNEAASQLPVQEPTRWMVLYLFMLFLMIVTYVWYSFDRFYFSIISLLENQI